jgi:hypothetical protein
MFNCLSIQLDQGVAAVQRETGTRRCRIGVRAVSKARVDITVVRMFRKKIPQNLDHGGRSGPRT